MSRDDHGVACIDLSDVSFIDAYGLVGVACCIASAAGDGLAVELLLPEREDVRSYLARMHLDGVFDTYDVRVDGALAKVNERDRRDSLIEFGTFQDSYGSDRLASFIWERLDDHAHPRIDRAVRGDRRTGQQRG